LRRYLSWNQDIRVNNSSSTRGLLLFDFCPRWCVDIKLNNNIIRHNYSITVLYTHDSHYHVFFKWRLESTFKLMIDASRFNQGLLLKIITWLVISFLQIKDYMTFYFFRICPLYKSNQIFLKMEDISILFLLYIDSHKYQISLLNWKNIWLLKLLWCAPIITAARFPQRDLYTCRSI